MLEEWLSRIARHAAEGNEKQLMTGLLKSAQRAYRHLRRGWVSDSSYAGWACRNLFDLHVLVRFVLASKDNRRRFMYDRLQEPDQPPREVDLTVATRPGRPDSETLLEHLGERLSALTAGLDSHLNPRKLAAQMGMSEEYEAMHALCAHLVHPTARLTMSVDADEQPARDVLLLRGSVCFSATMTDASSTVLALCAHAPVETDGPIEISARRAAEESRRKEPPRTREEVRRYSGMM